MAFLYLLFDMQMSLGDWFLSSQQIGRESLCY